MIYAPHRHKLLDSAITPEDAAQAGMRSWDAASAATLIYGQDSGRSLPGDALEIPFFDTDGTTRLRGLDGADFSRLRVFDPNKRMRYVSRASAGEHPYLPPQLYGIDPADHAFITIPEGEIKALAATVHGIPAIGVCGVSMGWDPARDKSATGERPLDPMLIKTVKRYGGAVLVADSDWTTKKHVRDSINKLAQAIRNQCGVVCAVTWVPAPAKKKAAAATSKATKDPMAQPGDTPADAEDRKIGLDDWIHDSHSNVDGIKRFLASAFEEEQQRQAALQTGGYEPLGYSGQSDVVIWSHPRQQVATLSLSSVMQEGPLTGLCGPKWCVAAYGKPSARDKDNVTIDCHALGRDLIDACNEKGPFERNAERGVGVWKDEDGGLILNGTTLWRPDGKPVSRVGGQYVYPHVGSVPVKPETLPATVDQSRELLTGLESWNWACKSDAILMFGWIGLGYVGGALANRPHMALTGAKESGKTTLQDLVRALFDAPRYAVAASMGQTSEAGIRQYVGQSSKPVCLDEAESNSVFADRIIESFRASFSGDQILKGTQGGQGVAFELRSIGMISGITLPSFKDSDESRFIVLHLNTIEASKISHRLLGDNYAPARELGPLMFSRTLHAWDRFKHAYALVAPRMTAGRKRFQKTYGAVIAMALAMLHDEPVTVAIVEDMLARVDLESARQRTEDSAAEVDMLGHVLSMPQAVSMGGRTGKMTIADLCSYAMVDGERGEYTRALGALGIRVRKYEASEQRKDATGAVVSGWYALIHVKSSGFLDLMKLTHWGAGQFAATLLRNKGAFKYVGGNDKVRIGGNSCAPIALAIDIQPAEKARTLADLTVAD